MQWIPALVAGVVTFVALVAAVAFLARRVRVVKQLVFPLYIAALAAGLKVFTLLDSGASSEFDEALAWVLVFLATVALLRVLGLYFFEVYLHTLRGVRLPPLLPAVVMGVAYFLAGLVILKLSLPDFNLGPLLATSAITSLVLGLALQPILGNFFSGIVISLEKPFRINDWVQLGETEGRVVGITWRTTHLRTRNNDNLVIPNALIAQEKILNFYYPHPMHMERVYVGVHYRTPPYRVRQAIQAAMSRVPKILEKPSPEVYLHDFADSAIVYEARAWIEDFSSRPRIANELRTEIWEEFRRRGITIPFPIRTLEFEPRANTLAMRRARPTAADSHDDGDVVPAAELYVARGPERGRAVTLDDEHPVTTVGRGGSCGITISDTEASKEHFRVEWTSDGYRLTDLDSTHGTRLNGSAVESALLNDLDRIQIGRTIIVLELHDA